MAVPQPKKSMNSTEFVYWLRGFLQASESITPAHEEAIREKLSNVSDYRDNPYPVIPCNTRQDIFNHCYSCPSGGEHEYPEIWHGIIPPNCRKCGKQADGMTITCG